MAKDKAKTPPDKTPPDEETPDAPQLPEITPKIRRRLQQCFDHGKLLSAQKQKTDYDYAHNMFAGCVVADPGNLVYVEAMLDNLQRKYNNNKKGSRIKRYGDKPGFKKAVTKKDWIEVLRLGPGVLQTNPWDVPTLRAMAEACEAQQTLPFNEVELRYLKNALVANPKNADVNRHCARSLGRMGQFDQAIACWHRVEEAKKGDEEAPRMIGDLTLAKQRRLAGFEDEETTAAEQVRDTARKADADEKERVRKENEQPAKRREITLTRRQELERAVVDFETDLDSYLDLANLHIEEGRLGDAKQVLAKALEVAGGGIEIRERIEDVEILAAQARVQIAEQKANTEKTDEAAELVKQLRDQLNRMELDVYGGRCERYPEDRGLKYELGRRLKRAGNYAEAIKQLNAARADDSRKTLATLELGECCQYLRQYKQALECYRRAAEGASDEELPQKKLALYRTGVLATGLKDLDAAQRSFDELQQLDPGYKDVSARLDKIKQIRDKE